MNYYAVIDTNVIVSGMLKRDSIPGEVLDLVLTGSIIPLLNEEIINEYKNVLKRNKFGFFDDDINETINGIIEKAIFLDRIETNELFADKGDVVFYEIALSGRKSFDAYLVTGNTKHFPIDTFIVTPRQMIEIIYNNLLQITTK